MMIFGTVAFALAGCSTTATQETTNNTNLERPSECVAEQASQLVGQSNLSEAQIKQLTKANTVRIVSPTQPMTMDYRFDRVTVVVDPATKKIVKASCG